MKHKKIIISIITLLFVFAFFIFSQKTTATLESEDTFFVLDENGNPQTIDIDTNNSSIRQKTRTVSMFTNQNTVTTYANTSSHIVRFKTVAQLGGDVVTYTEVDTGREGYFNTNMATDAAYISTDSSGNVICKLSGVVMKVPASCVKEIVPYTDEKISYYYVSDGKLLHYFTYINGSSITMASNRVGLQPDYLQSGKKYYSYDGHYFYTSFENMIKDYKNYATQAHDYAVNKDKPYYNYYQYLSLRSKTTFTASQLNKRITSTSSKMYNKAQTFIDTQNTYGINASLMFGIAINESSYGNSNIAQTKNNLFGLNAVDKSPTESANYFSNVDQCIEEFAYEWMSQGYLDGNDYRYRGPHLGDKRSGINVKYASDPYWGEKAASQNYFVENMSQDYQQYTIGISTETILTLYKNTNTSTRIYSSAVNSSGTKAYLYDYPVLILSTQKDSANVNWYKVQSDMPLKTDRSARDVSAKYNYERDYVYTKVSLIQIVNDGKKEEPSEPSITNAQIITQLSLKNNNGYLTGFQVGSDVKTLISKINSIAPTVTVTIKNATGTQITSSTIATQMTLTLKNGSTTNTYTIVIRGDVNGDGAIKSSDYVRIKNYIMGSVTLNAAGKLAADANNDGSIKSSDYVRIKNYIMSTAKIEQ